MNEVTGEQGKGSSVLPSEIAVDFSSEKSCPEGGVSGKQTSCRDSSG